RHTRSDRDWSSDVCSSDLVFLAATKAKNAKNALAFLSGIDEPATQLAFSKAKGSIPVVHDVDVSSLPAYQRMSTRAFWTSPVLRSEERRVGKEWRCRVWGV